MVTVETLIDRENYALSDPIDYFLDHGLLKNYLCFRIPKFLNSAWSADPAAKNLRIWTRSVHVGLETGPIPQLSGSRISGPRSSQIHQEHMKLPNSFGTDRVC